MTSSSDSSSLYISTVQSGLSGPFANAALPPNPRLQTSYLLSAYFVSSPSAPSLPLLTPGCLSTPPASPFLPNSLRGLQWNAGGFRASSTELQHFFRLIPLILFIDFFSPPIFSSTRNLFNWGHQLPSSSLGLKGYFRHPLGGNIRLGHLF